MARRHPHRGHSPSAATRAKISKALRGRHHPHKGHRLSAATRAKISRSLKGRHHKGHRLSAATRAKISASLKRHYGAHPRHRKSTRRVAHHTHRAVHPVHRRHTKYARRMAHAAHHGHGRHGARGLPRRSRIRVFTPHPYRATRQSRLIGLMPQHRNSLYRFGRKTTRTRYYRTRGRRLQIRNPWRVTL